MHWLIIHIKWGMCMKKENKVNFDFMLTWCPFAKYCSLESLFNHHTEKWVFQTGQQYSDPVSGALLGHFIKPQQCFSPQTLIAWLLTACSPPRHSVEEQHACLDSTTNPVKMLWNIDETGWRLYKHFFLSLSASYGHSINGRKKYEHH